MTKPKAKTTAVPCIPTPDLRTAIVDLARRFVGVHERGHNSGPEVELFQRWAGGAASAARHDAWCAAFCDYVYEHACAECHATPLLNIGLSDESVHGSGIQSEIDPLQCRDSSEPHVNALRQNLCASRARVGK